MTPAPISVERLRELIAEYWDLAYAEGAESRSHDTPAGDAMRVSAEIDKCIAALLHQLAERDAALEREQGVREDAQRQLRAAERAREEATEDAATERALQRAAEKLPDGWEISVVVENGAGWVTLHDPEGELVEFEDSDRTIAQQVTEATDTAIAAFLAASGGA